MKTYLLGCVLAMLRILQSRRFDVLKQLVFPQGSDMQHTSVISFLRCVLTVYLANQCLLTRAAFGQSVAGCKLLSLACHSTDLRP